MTSTNDIRQAFLDYFAENDHRVVPSSSLVPHNDPTLLFTNAGMVQFKNVFTGMEKRDYARAASSQKCVRAGGKHNDLENVGYTARHHTFFEMLGNFSFGDYFKERAIELAWTLITREFGVAKDRLCVTVYHEDDEAFDLWKKVAGLPDGRIIRIATSDNFWAMGDTGPCGPCSEIFYDHGAHIPGGPPGSADEDGDRFVEIWNLVFMQYDQGADGVRRDLPRPSIDTGMGLERIAAVLQGKHDNYDTDTLRALVEASAHAAKVAPDGDHAVSNRVIADHLRASAFLIADGVLPSNEGRGYVLRRIMRRAMRHAHMMGCKDPLMYRLVPALVAQMGKAYPELGRAESLIAETLELEETRFKALLDRGLKLLFEETERLGDGAALPGDVAFRLYDTFGFPLDLTQDVLRGQGRGVDTKGFDEAMARQRAEARKAWAGSGQAADEAVWFDIRERAGATEFLGYATESAEGKVVAIVRDGAETESVAAGEEAIVVLNQTPFYGESGGQMGDTGILFTGDGAEFAVSDAQKKLGALHLHLGKVARGTLSVGDVVEARVDGERRSALRAHHSATHLLHEALRRRLGDHVTQKGSLVAPDRLRFDISHPRPIPADDLRAIADEVNERVRINSTVTTRLMAPEEAIEAGAMALFGEKYGDEVRVVAMGAENGDRFSVELCGGTHVRRTGDIGFFKIVSEGAVGAGVRRIEAVTGRAAQDHIAETDAALQQAAQALNARPAELAARISALLEERKKLEHELSEARRKLATGGGNGASGAGAKEIAGVRFVRRELDGVPAKELKSMADALKKEIGSGVVSIAASADGKASLVVAVTDDLTDRLDAVALVRVGAVALGGKGGGGRPDMAQAGGPDAGKLADANNAVEQALAG
ncbi:MAG: alanine--tRNA ligase [Alphaproteobacteria bacterium]|nr:alanine--tRNA ligase [Alphaproteobacteria bacterium]